MCYLFRKRLLNRKAFIFASSSFPKHSTLGNTSSSFPEHLTLEDAKSSIIALGLGLGSALVSSSPLGYVLLTVYSETTT